MLMIEMIMKEQRDFEISDEDLRAALKEMKTYVDVTEEDLKKIYSIALKHSQKRIALKVPVRDVMTRDVIAVKADVNIHELSRLMCEKSLSGLPVADDDNCVIGMVTEADILHVAGLDKDHKFRDVLRHILGEPFPEHKKGEIVDDIMTSPAITAKSDDNLRDVAKTFDEKRIERLPVVDDQNKLIGVISRADIIRALGK